MLKSKMVELLSYFTPKEFTKFGEYLASPFFNKDEDVIAVYKYIKPFAPEFESKKLDKQFILTNGIPGISINEKKLGYLMNYMVEHAEAFIKINQSITNEASGQLLLLKKYNEWGAGKFFEKTLEKTLKDGAVSTVKDNEYLLFRYQLEVESTTYFDKQKVRAFDPSLQQASDYLDLFYISTKLKYLCELMNRQQLVAANYEMRLLQEIFTHVKSQKYEESAAVTVYYQILMLFLEGEDEQHFHQLKLLLQNNIKAFTASEARDIFTYAQNYCITKANNGKQEFLNELLHLYKISIEEGFIIIDGNISPWAYKNIVSVATRVGDIVWAESFIKNYIQYVHIKFKDNAYNYNLAYLYYMKKQFGEALQLLNAVEFTDVFYSLDSRTLQVKIYYEMNEISPLLSSLDAFRVYLRRNKIISDSMRTVYANFIKFTDKLIKYSHDKAKKEQLREDIIKSKLVADINWLLNKLNMATLFLIAF